MIDRGFLPLNRRVFEHYLWCEDRDFSKFEAWLDLLQSARFEDSETKQMIGGRLMTWKRGQLPASIGYLRKRWGWTSDKRVRTFLDLLESDEMIRREQLKGNPVSTVTICNYDTYNPTNGERGRAKAGQGQARGRARAGKGQQTNKENKGNKENNKDSELKLEFENFRQKYRGRKRGLDVEFNNLKSKHKNWREIIPLLLPSLNKQLAWFDKAKELNAWSPQYPMLQTWVNQSRWTEEFNDSELKQKDKNKPININSYSDYD